MSEQAGVEQVHRLDRLPDVARHDQPLYVLPTAHARQLLADLLAHAPREALRRLAVAVVDEVGQHHVVQHRLAPHTGQVRSVSHATTTHLLVPLLPGPAELLDAALCPAPQLPHLSLDIKLERFLAKVGVDNLARSLQSHRGVQSRRQV